MSWSTSPTRRLAGAAGAVCMLVGGMTIASSVGTASAVSDTLVINEVDYDQPSTDTAEFLELYNRSDSPVDVTGYQVELVNGSTDSIYNTIALEGTVAAGDYLVICANAATVANCDVDASPDTNFIQNGAPDAIGLRDASGALIDSVSYEGDTTGYTEGSGAGVVDASLDGVGIARCANGVDTDVNDDDFQNDRPITPGAENDCADDPGGGGPGEAPDGLVVNEIDYDQAGSDTAEFLEIYNGSPETVSLGDYAVELVNGTGGGAAVYNSIALSGTLAPDDYFVVCANAATVANCDLDASPDTNFIQNGAPDAVALVLGSEIVDTISYEGDTGAPYTEGSGSGVEDDPNAGDVGIARCDNGVDTDQNNDDVAGDRPITPGAQNDCETGGGGPDFGVCGDEATFIHEVQGDGFSSPIVNSEVVVEGVVVGDFQESDQLSGFFVQEEDADADDLEETSEGVFVFAPGSIDVAMGDVVRVGGSVVEFFGLTEINAVTDVAVCSGEATATPATIVLPVDSATETWERSEGMGVSFTQELFVSGNFTLARFGEVDLSVGGPLDNPTNVAAPGAPAAAVSELNNRSRIQLDDGSTIQNPVPIPPYFAPDGTLRTGDSVEGLTGVLSYGFGVYEVHPTAGVNFVRENERPTDAPDVGGSMTVSAYNVLNYFTTIDNAGPICGPELDQGCRGADTADELQRQQDKIVSALVELDADVVGLIEIENAPDDGPTATLVAALNDALGSEVYAYLPTGAIGSDAIRVAFIYKPAAVEAVGSYAVLDSSVDPDFDDERNRPALAQTFREIGTDDLVTVAVNHLKSKGSACTPDDPDVGDGQGNCNLTRTAAANALAAWMAGDPTGSGSSDNVIIGDLNSYAMEDPIVALEGAGYTDLIEEYVGTGFADGAYSYNFFSESGYLDHGLASPSLVERITGAAPWHVNADEPSGLDYNNFNQDVLYQPDPYRSSDHDPVVIGICEATPPVVDVSTDRDVLGPPNHKYVDVSTTVDVVDADPDASVVLVGVTSNEADNGLGDGDTTNDIVIVDDTTFRLRAERSGQGSGRVYTITYEVTDACGNSTIASAEVRVEK